MKISLIDRNDEIQRHLIGLIKSKGAEYWKETGDRVSLKLFHQMAERVPAYKDFLKKQKVRASSVRTSHDLSLVPPINKDNYLRAYPYPALMWDGSVARPLTIHSTSGTTGMPTYFMRNVASDFKRKLVMDNFFRYNPMTTEGPTLLIIGLGMGVWSAGVGVYTGAYLSTNIGRHSIAIITPGVNKTEFVKILKNMAPNFKQVVIAAYPPFAKDVLDDAADAGVNLKALNLRFIFTGEAFSEEFRDYLKTKAHVRNLLVDTMNIYGTSELGPTAVETPLTILTRRLLDEAAFADLFGDIRKVPTLAQYVPSLVNFDCTNGELYFTGDDAIPLMRYESGDHGGIFSFDEMRDMLAHHNIDILKEARRANIARYLTKLPFVYVYERKNLVTTLYGALVYPEYIKVPLLDRSLHPFVTGKFSMLQRYDRKQDQYLEVNVELKRNVRPSERVKRLVLKKVVEGLKARSSEFTELYKNLGERMYPKLVFWPYEHPLYFAPGSKQQWVKKT